MGRHSGTSPYDAYETHSGHTGYDGHEGYDPYVPGGYLPDGYATDGYAQNGYAPDPYATGAYTADQYPANGYTPGGYAPDGYAAAAYGTDGYAAPQSWSDPYSPHTEAPGHPYPDQHTAPDYASYAAPMPQQPYWEDPAYWEAPADPPGGARHGIPHQTRYAEQPQYAYPDVYDPEPAAWGETTYVEPVDELPQESRVFAGTGSPVPSDYDFTAEAYVDQYADDYADDAPEDGSDGAYAPYDAYDDDPATAYVPSSGGGRAASRRAAKTSSRRPRRLAAAGGAVVTGAVLAGAVAFQMPDGNSSAQASGDSAVTDDQPRATDDAASRDSDRPQVQGGVPPKAFPVPSATTQAASPTAIPVPTPSAPLTLTDRMKVRFALDATLSLSGKFETVPGRAGSAGSSGVKTTTYRVEIEQGLALDGKLFAEAVQQTLNDQRSWARDNRVFVRTDAQQADFVIRLASPGTTHRLCAAAGLDTSIQNVSCDAGSSPWVVINAWRWAQGSPTFGDEMVAYREMLINHEVGHRLGRNHETASCLPNGLAPVMMQQTKTLEADNGQACRPNAWPYPA